MHGGTEVLTYRQSGQANGPFPLALKLIHATVFTSVIVCSVIFKRTSNTSSTAGPVGDSPFTLPEENIVGVNSFLGLRTNITFSFQRW